MKKIVALVLAGLSLGANAQTKTPVKPEPAHKATLNCTVHGDRESGLSLYQLKDGKVLSLGFKRPDAKGNCSFNLDVKEGVFFFKRAGSGGKGNNFNYVMYLKAGEQKKVDFFIEKLEKRVGDQKNLDFNIKSKRTGTDYDSCSITKPNAETKSLQSWLNAMNDYTHAVKTKPSLGRTKYAQFEQFAASFLKSKQTDNSYFNAWLNDKVAVDLNYLRAGNYFGLGRLNADCDSGANAQAFYKPLLDKNLINDARLLRSEHGMELLDYVFGYWKFNEVKDQQKVLDNLFSAENAAKINNNAVKVAFLIYKMPIIKEYEHFVKYVEPCKNLFVTEEQKAAYNLLYNKLGPFAKGNPGYNFELKDVNDKTYTLAGLKGKVVVIDIWAMWCAPCLQEKPIMEKIAEGYHDRNDIAFIGISVDGHSKKEVWKSFVKKRGFTSIELLTQSDESLYKFYNISNIPRFLIFDREGKIVTVDAPKPSNPEFKKLIDASLGIN